ncbi:Crp/Fnr family transcriptional regulator [Flaviaesturariibacter aridisoli]|uniref:Crp/Fnr family transcriptional regulator n=1 Tax=Flaviaesturariibacter aridisoli TaxID=2545761 RepID=A0A4R4E6K7_9BACT|nr:Crp/Fnr family transcriptional regulator [Flaviaesturariibacter aridisoli]TCZ73338.1 Crp/Fnr family transcriptional regulator [Flaviaesturariibacter aridisoli]
MTENELGQYFPSLEPELLAEMIRAGDIRELPEGAVLMRTGQNIRTTLLVLEGLVKVYREDEDGAEFFMYYLDSGEACAVSLVCELGKEQSGLMVKAVTNATVLAIPLQQVDAWMGRYKSWAQFSVSSYRERFDELLQTIDQVAFHNMDERLVFYLRRYQEKFGINEVPVSFTEIAQDLNSSREVVSRLMKKLSDRGAVRLLKSGVEIVDLGDVLP